MMNEETIIQHASRYSVFRDAFLLVLIGIHVLFYYGFFERNNVLLFSIIVASALAWFIFYGKSILFYQKIKKDNYLKNIIKDEGFLSIVKNAGYHGYTAMFIVCACLILINILLSALSINIIIPSIITCEIIIFLSLLTDDISKLIQIRR